MSRRALLKQAAKQTGMSEWELSCGARSGKYPAMRAGGERGRWVFDLDLLETRIQELMLQNIKEDVHDESQYGKIRRIGG